MNEQEVNNKLIFNMLNFIENAEDRDESRFVLIVAEKTIQQYVLSMEKFGLFKEWWEDDFLKKEAKKFLKIPTANMFSTLKQDVFGQSSGEVYTLYFHLKSEAKHYHKSIVKKKMSYLVNNSSLTLVKLDKFNSETKLDEEIFNEEYKPQKKNNLVISKGELIQ